MAVLIRYTANDENNAPNVDATTNTLGQTTGSPVTGYGDYQWSATPVPGSKAAGHNPYTAQYGFDSIYGDYLLGSNLQNQPTGGYLEGFAPITADYLAPGQIWDYNQTTGNTIKYGHTYDNGGSVGGGVTVAWDLGLRQSTPGDPAWARKQAAENSLSNYYNTYDPVWGPALTNEKGQLRTWEERGEFMATHEYNSATNSFQPTGFELFTGTGRGFLEPQTVMATRGKDGNWYDTVAEAETKFGMPSLLPGYRYLSREGAEAAGMKPGAFTSPLYRSDPNASLGSLERNIAAAQAGPSWNDSFFQSYLSKAPADKYMGYNPDATGAAMSQGFLNEQNALRVQSSINQSLQANSQITIGQALAGWKPLQVSVTPELGGLGASYDEFHFDSRAGAGLGNPNVGFNQHSGGSPTTFGSSYADKLSSFNKSWEVASNAYSAYKSPSINWEW